MYNVKHLHGSCKLDGLKVFASARRADSFLSYFLIDRFDLLNGEGLRDYSLGVLKYFDFFGLRLVWLKKVVILPIASGDGCI
ncbi:hypothetical protein QVD17_27511 [Tagetes erecta]|uniref:Uncharacterized protein n=1 Tax=Tagetes erecta TaxID=13708 RepID=A0AAD8NRP5_TARER|nr:hypothetical protein QVD17_27511 [Tagetes erecta]